MVWRWPMARFHALGAGERGGGRGRTRARRPGDHTIKLYRKKVDRVDKRTTSERGEQEAIAKGLHTIKAHMPQTYAEIQRQAQARGNAVFGLVRHGCSGQADCFYAIERGHVVGTPFAQAVDPALAAAMLQFGVGFFVMLQIDGGSDAAH